MQTLPAEVRAAGIREDYRQAANLQDRLTETTRKVQEGLSLRVDLVGQQTEAERKLHEAGVEVTRRMGERAREAEAMRRRHLHAELRANPKSELHKIMLGTADEIGGLFELANSAGDASRFLVEPRQLVFGQPVEAARGVEHYMNVPVREVRLGMADGIAAIRREVARHGSADARECLEYVLEKEAGSDPTTFQGGLKRDCDSRGNLLPSRRLRNGRGMRLSDFVAHPISVRCGLEEPEVVGIRYYSTAAYEFINNPLRDQDRHRMGEPHPLPITVTFIREGLRKLRAVAAHSERANQQV